LVLLLIFHALPTSDPCWFLLKNPVFPTPAAASSSRGVRPCAIGAFTLMAPLALAANRSFGTHHRGRSNQWWSRIVNL